MSKKTLYMEDIAESFEKCAIADVIIALCQTKAEKEADIMRLHLIKARDSKSIAIANVDVDFGISSMSECE